MSVPGMGIQNCRFRSESLHVYQQLVDAVPDWKVLMVAKMLTSSISSDKVIHNNN